MNHATSYRTGLIVLALVAGGIAAAPVAAYAATGPGQPAPIVTAVSTVGWDCSARTAYRTNVITTTDTTLVNQVWVASAPTVITVQFDIPSTAQEMVTHCGITPPKTLAVPLPQSAAVPVIQAKSPTVAAPVAPVAAKVAQKAPAKVLSAAPVAAPAPVVAAAPVEPAVIAPTVVSVPTDPWAACDYLICLAA